MKSYLASICILLSSFSAFGDFLEDRIQASSQDKRFAPQISYDPPNGQHEIITVAPDADGISWNWLNAFGVTLKWPLLRVDNRTKTVVLHVTGDAPTRMSFADASAPVQNCANAPLLIINNPNGITCNKVVFGSSKVQLSTHPLDDKQRLGTSSAGTIEILLSGLNASLPLSLEANTVVVGGPVFGADTVKVKAEALQLSRDGRLMGAGEVLFDATKITSSADVLAQNVRVKAQAFEQVEGSTRAVDTLDIKSTERIQNSGALSGLLVNLEAPFVSNLCKDSAKCQIVAGVQDTGDRIIITPHANRLLNITAEHVHNQGVMHSDDRVVLSGKADVNNEGRISSNGLLLLETNALTNKKGEILSKADARLKGFDQNRMQILENLSGEIHAAKDLYLSAQRVDNRREKLEFDKEAKVAFDKHKVCFAGPDGELCVNAVYNAEVERGNQNPAVLMADGNIILDCAHVRNDASIIYTQGYIEALPGPSKTVLEDVAHQLAMTGRVSTLDHVAAGPVQCHPGPGGKERCTHSRFESKTARTICAKRISEILIAPGLLCTFNSGEFCKSLAANCKTPHQTVPALISAALGLRGEAENFKLEQVRNEYGQFKITERFDVDKRIKPIKAEDHVINLYEKMHQMAADLRCYNQAAAGLLPSGDVLVDLQSVSSDLNEGMGTRDIMQQYGNGAGALAYVGDARLEHAAINSALYSRLGHALVRAKDLFHNAIHIALKLGFKPGERPTPEQIAKLPPGKPIVWPVIVQRPEYGGLARVEPELILDSYTLESSVAHHGSVVEAGYIELEVANQAQIDGLLRSTNGSLLLKAKEIYVPGEISSAEDLKLLADEKIFLETLAEQVLTAAGVKDIVKSKARVHAKGEAHLESGQDVNLVAAEVKGSSVLITAHGKVVAIPLALYEQAQASWKKDMQVLTETYAAQSNVFNSIAATSGNAEINGDENVDIKGAHIAAENDVIMNSTQGNVTVSGAEAHRKTKKHAVDVHDRESETSTLTERYHEPSTINAKGSAAYEAAYDINFEGVHHKAAKTTAKAGHNVNSHGTRASREFESHKHANYILSWAKRGVFYLFGYESEDNYQYDETTEHNEMHFGVTDVHAGNKVDFLGTHIVSEGGSIRGENGARFDTLKNAHVSNSVSEHGGLYVQTTNDAGEATIGIGAGGGMRMSSKNAVQDTADLIETNNELVLDGGNGELLVHGVDQRGHKITKRGKKILEEGRTSRVCVDELAWEASVGIKVGVKSKLTQAISDTIGTTQQEVHMVEDGINIAFRATKNGVDLISGVLVPFEFGVWYGAKNGGEKSHQCFDIVEASKIELIEFAYDADELIRLLGVDLAAQSGSIKSKNLEVGALKATGESNFQQFGSNFEVMLQGMGSPGSIGGSHQQSNSKREDWVNSKIRVFGRLDIDVADKGAFRGAQVQAGELMASFGDLLVESLLSRENSMGSGFNLAIDPEGATAIKKIVGVGMQKQSGQRQWINELTSLVGVDKATVIVRMTLELVGGVIAHAEVDANGKMTDKGNLQLSTARLIVQDIVEADHNLSLGLNLARGSNRAIYGSASGSVAYTNKSGGAHATIGQGKIEVKENPEVLERVNRDLDRAREEMSGVEIKQIDFYVPFIDFKEGDKLVNELKEALSNPQKHLEKTFKRNMQGMTWFVDPKEWTPEEDLRLQNFLERFKVYGQNTPVDEEIAALNEALDQKQVEAEDNEARKIELEQAQKALAQADLIQIGARMIDDDSKKEGNARKAEIASSMRKAKEATVKAAREVIDGKVQPNGMVSAFDPEFLRDIGINPNNLGNAGHADVYRLLVAIRLANGDIWDQLQPLIKDGVQMSQSQIQLNINMDDGKRSLSAIWHVTKEATIGNPRFMGGVQALGGFVQMAGGAAIGGASAWTGVGAIGGIAVVGLGVDNVVKGIYAVATGEEVPTVAQSWFQAAGLSPRHAAMAAAVVDIFTSLGGARAAALATSKDLILARALKEVALDSEKAGAKASASLAGSHAKPTKYKIEWGKQDKHIEGTNNYKVVHQSGDTQKSIVTHPDPQKLVDDFVGTGERVAGIPGQPGYRERIDFHEDIGFFHDTQTKITQTTTVGVVHFSKEGVHIVPARPNCN